jgi:hypothetical protein
VKLEMQYDEIRDAYRSFVNSLGPQGQFASDKVQSLERNIEELNHMYT